MVAASLLHFVRRFHDKSELNVSVSITDFQSQIHVLAKLDHVHWHFVAFANLIQIQLSILRSTSGYLAIS